MEYEEIGKRESSGPALKSQRVEFERPSTPGFSSELPGENIVRGMSYFEIAKKLASYGFKPLITMYTYGQVGKELVFIYCMTQVGQYCFVRPPGKIKIETGNVELVSQRIDVVEDDVKKHFDEELKDLYTEYLYVCNGGIRVAGTDEIYGYSDPELVREGFKVKKYQCILYPLVDFTKLRIPDVFNTIEIGLRSILSDEHISLYEDTGVLALLTNAGPFTLLLPSTKRLNSLVGQEVNTVRAHLLAGVFIGNVDESKVFKALAQNEATLELNDGVLTVSEKSGTAKSIRKISKYNGTIYEIDGILTPVSTSFTMPSINDIDNIVTIFDVIKSSMEIRRAHDSLNVPKQKRLIEILGHVNSLTVELQSEIRQKFKTNGDELLHESNNFIEMFYGKEYPCTEECTEITQAARKIMGMNVKFEKVAVASNALSAMKVEVEKLYLQLSKISQILHQ